MALRPPASRCLPRLLASGRAALAWAPISPPIRGAPRHVPPLKLSRLYFLRRSPLRTPRGPPLPSLPPGLEAAPPPLPPYIRRRLHIQRPGSVPLPNNHVSQWRQPAFPNAFFLDFACSRRPLRPCLWGCVQVLHYRAVRRPVRFWYEDLALRRSPAASGTQGPSALGESSLRMRKAAGRRHEKSRGNMLTPEWWVRGHMIEREAQRLSTRRNVRSVWAMATRKLLPLRACPGLEPEKLRTSPEMD